MSSGVKTPSSVTIDREQLGRREFEELALGGAWIRRVDGLHRRELHDLGGDDYRDPVAAGGLGERRGADLVAEGAVAEHRVGADEEDGRAGERRRGGFVLHELDVEPFGAQPFGEGSSLTDGLGDRADDAVGVRMQERLAHRCGRGVCGCDGAVELFAQVNRDRGAGPRPPVEDGLALFANQLAKIVQVEVAPAVRRREHAARGARNGADSRAALGELASGGDELIDERLDRLERLLGDLEERLDRSPRHPARPMLTVFPELFDRGG